MIKSVQIFFLLMLSILFTNLGWTAVLVEEDGKNVTSNRQSYSISDQTSFGFRKDRKIGVGLTTAGASGIFGPHLEINFTPASSFIGGFGLGPNYQSFSLEYKKIIGGSWFVPYLLGGYSRWYTVGGRQDLGETNPGFLADRFLNRTERDRGEFAINLIYPALGFQYLQLSGDWAGLSLYAEIMLLVDVIDLVSAPTGEAGMTFYF